MNSFQHIIMITAIIILIICLIVIGVALHANETSNIYPPVIADCPDYWEASNSGCINTYDLGYNTASCKNQNIKTLTSNCNKQTWARNCNLTWDGITNNVDLCSSTTN